ncbi:MAG: ATP-binding cassette domain-containing protein [Bacteroidetes bacterium]|nr:ATP-binding cassette domain-containing protein [Bacteroidota bacterium]HET6243240.1 ATP-binding cassette domain-containing protein [Bacteroidia bacterium]
MISVNQLSIHFTGTSLFDNVSFIVNTKDRIGLTGKNGAGKSTLLKILAKQIEPEKGNVAIPSGGTIGYLPQEMEHNNGKTVFEETSSAFVEAKKLQRDLEYYNEQLTSRIDYESEGYYDIINKLNEANERFSMIGGYSMEADIEKILLGLGFSKDDFNRLTDEFSGGWRMRIELAKILLQNSDVLLLDEPTNHLDIESIQWLEEFLLTYRGAVVLVSHDRAFLDNVTTRTIEISLGKINDYKASYSKYIELRTERREQQLSAFKNQQKQIEETEKFIDRFRSKASKAIQVQSKIKHLNKIDRIEVDEEDLQTINFYFPPSPRSGKVVVLAENLKKQYDNHVVLNKVDFDIERGERVAFVGKNGQGKSTLSKLIAGLEKNEGKLELGHNVEIGYFAQNQAESLDGNKTVLQTIEDAARGDMLKKARSLLGSFLFSGDTVDKKVKVLSGGEKSRLAMCKLLLEPVNLLVLDEPTNHLDMRSKDVLKNALMKYDGTLIVVSHDRDFLQGLTNKVFEFAGGNISEHYGDVYEYLATRKLSTLHELEQVEKKNQQEKISEVKIEKPKSSDLSNEDKKLLEKENKRLSNQIGKSEREIERLEKEIALNDEKLQDSEQYKLMMNDKVFFTEYEKLKKQLEEELNLWEKLQTELEGIQK